MGIPLGLTGLREITPYRFCPDAGIAFVNGNIPLLRSSGLAAAVAPTAMWPAPNGLTVTPGALGATQGGTEIDPKLTISRVPVDDVRVPLMGLSRVDDSDPTCQLNVIEVADKATLMMGLGPCDEEDAPTASGFNVITQSLVIAMRHYLGNIILAVSTSEDGQPRPLIIVVHNPLCLEPAKFKTNSKGIVLMQAKMTAHQPISQATVFPIQYFVPVPLGSGS